MRNNQFSKYRSLGLNIAYYRKDRGLSQSELAERVKDWTPERAAEIWSRAPPLQDRIKIRP